MMEKQSNFETLDGDGVLSLTKQEGDFGIREIGLPKLEDAECQGIWNDNVIFDFGETRISMHPEMLFEMIASLKKDLPSSWFNPRSKDLARKIDSLVKGKPFKI